MRRVGALVFPGFELLDLFGPLEMLGLLDTEFELVLVAEALGPVVSNQQVSAVAEARCADPAHYDILFVPGGKGTRREASNPALLAWIADQAASAELVLSVCTGSLLLAKAGVLDGKQATTNKAAFGFVAGETEGVDWVREARWVEDGKIFTSSGVSAGMDMTLGALARLFGRAKAEQVAMWCEYSWHEDKTRDPFAQLHGLV